MTVLVGYVQGEGGTGGVQLGAMLAESAGTDLVVATVVPKPWTTPSMAKVDAEYASWTDEIVTKAEQEIADYMTIYPPDLDWRFVRLDHRTAASALSAHAVEIGARVLVISSANGGQLGQIVTGSTADWLLHRSPTPVALSPRGYRSPKDGKLTRITVAYAGTDDDGIISRARDVAGLMAKPMRVVTFAVRGGAMYPPLVGIRTENQVLDQWIEQSTAAQQKLAADGVIESGTPTEVASGTGWREAVDSIEWIEGEVLFVGSSHEGLLSQVFVGSRAHKLIRHSPVPVVVLPR
ncbi:MULTISPECIES: universal stress protein [unclassified Gordonia (in: high G+C Gram-positive bacteria)]|uniref:universal stress protein n=1 Tax=unclassified Gordonia (in: high G+C Gram-positive bacteria) TaxID=2657482 RepID=UPI001F101B36|nr:universal stress protein [Gordonia sp. ABSL49_1]MCH5645662.1 universal stress protein [Gordonia sp. ABSL49_1]